MGAEDQIGKVETMIEQDEEPADLRRCFEQSRDSGVEERCLLALALEREDEK